MIKAISNQCDKEGSPYITHLDFLKTIAHYDENGIFQYLQSTDGTKYTPSQLQSMKMTFNLKLLDPDYQWNKGSILAEDKNTPKGADVEISPNSQSKSCVNLDKLGEGTISLDSTWLGCDISELFNEKDVMKIKLTDGATMGKEFAMLGGTVNLTDEGNWIDLGLNKWELSNIRVEITKQPSPIRRWVEF